jgi:hypothetical protein
MNKLDQDVGTGLVGAPGMLHEKSAADRANVQLAASESGVGLGDR